MKYDLNALLFKLGLNTLVETGEVRWCYVDDKAPELSGNAHARLANDKRDLIVELNHDYLIIDDEDGPFGEMCHEHVELRARRIEGTNEFEVTHLAFDGSEHDPKNEAMLQLCCGLFYARALKVNEMAFDQKFEREMAELDALQTTGRKADARRRRAIAQTVRMANNVADCVVAFRPRQRVAAF